MCPNPLPSIAVATALARVSRSLSSIALGSGHADVFEAFFPPAMASNLAQGVRA